MVHQVVSLLWKHTIKKMVNKMKATPHIQVTEENVIAKTVLMPGDPLRAKFIAENLQIGFVCRNIQKIRNI